MVKSLFNYLPWLDGAKRNNPPPPPLPPYDPSTEEPKCDWPQLFRIIPAYPEDPDRPKKRGTVAISDDKPDWRGVIKNNVIPLPKVTPYDWDVPHRQNYFFFDTPDYADPFKKLWYAFKFFSMTGITYWSINCIWMCHDNNMQRARMLALRFIPRWVFGGMTFATSAIAVANLRGNKDDMYNYFIAGLVAGAATGRANYLVHLRHTIFWTCAGMYTKYNAEINGNMTFKINRNFQNKGISGNDAEGGLLTGDLRLLRSKRPDPGRDANGLTI